MACLQDRSNVWTSCPQICEIACVHVCVYSRKAIRDFKIYFYFLTTDRIKTKLGKRRTSLLKNHSPILLTVQRVQKLYQNGSQLYLAMHSNLMS